MIDKPKIKIEKETLRQIHDQYENILKQQEDQKNQEEALSQMFHKHF